MNKISKLEKELLSTNGKSKNALRLKKEIEKILKSFGYDWTYERAIEELSKANNNKLCVNEIRFIPTVKGR